MSKISNPSKIELFYVIVGLLLYVASLYAMPTRYIYWTQTIPVFPDNQTESALVYQLTLERSQNDIDFFNKTDYSVVYAFNEIVDIPLQHLFDIISQANVMFLMLSTKYTFNRARPWQVDTRIRKLKSTTDKTPSYPAGHALQAYYLAYVLGKQYPHRQSHFDKIAYECDRTRVYAGIHYPSDGAFSKYLVFLMTTIGYM